jgi:hypothetical protein
MLVRMSARAILLIAALAACGSPARTRMYPAGSDKDDGNGDLAQKSARLLTSSEPEPALSGRRHAHRRDTGDPYGGDPYGGAMYAGDPDDPPGDVGDAAYTRPWSHPSAPVARYNAATGLTGAIVGTVTWRGSPAAPLVTSCGPIDPGVRVGPHNAAGGVLVYIEHVDIGRALPSYGRPAIVGGMIAKRGCVLAPALQIVTPLPAALAIHGDATEIKLRVTEPGGTRPFALQEAGRILLQAAPGVTRIEADDGSLGAAWVVAATTPYYAITDDTGRFRLDELAAGTYDVTFLRPPVPGSSNGRLVYGAPVITHRSIKVDPVKPARLDVALDR